MCGVSLTVHRGQVVAIIGPSGCGKSTLLHCIYALEEPSGRIVRLGDQVMDYDKPRSLPKGRAFALFRSRLGKIFQQFDLFQNKNVLENVMLGQVVVQRKSTDEAAKVARHYLARVGLSEFEAVMPTLRRPAAACSDCPCWSLVRRCCCSTMSRLRWIPNSSERCWSSCRIWHREVPG